MRCKSIVLAIAIGSVLSSAASAADPNLMFPDQAERSRAAGYVGVSISFKRNAGREAVPAFRLGMGVRRISTSVNSSSVRNSLLELEPADTGSPLYVGDRRLSAAEGEGGLGAGTILLILAAGAGAVFLITQASDSDDDDEQCMIEPELCD